MADKISKPGRYEGYSEEKYHMGNGHSVYVPMRDHTKLAVDYYIPYQEDTEVDEALPALLIFTPYPYRKEFNDKTLPACDQFSLGEKMVRRGYVFVIADVRGTGVSYGSRKLTNGPSDVEDTWDLLEWIGTQPWCNGKIGMAGFSYFGGTQLSALISNSPYLKACFIGMTDIDKYDGWVRGGVVRKFGTQPDADYLLDLNNPAVDEDIDGNMRLEAVNQHKYSNRLGDSMTDCPYRDSYYEKEDCLLWETIGKSYFLDRINQSGAIVYLYGGWRDEFRRDTILMYRNMTLPKKLIIGDWIHMDDRPGFDMDLEHIRFFDYALKNIENGIFKEPPIYYATAGNGMQWSFADTWPPEAEMMKFYLTKGELHTYADGACKPERYVARYDIGEDFRASLETVERQEKGLNYYSAPLQSDVCMQGHGIIHLVVSCNEPDADLFLSLIDVDETGRGRYVTDGVQRLSLSLVCGVPHYDYMNLPWHRSNRSDEQFLVDRQPVEVIFDFLPTSYLFQKGHRILISIATSCQGYCYQERPGTEIMVHHQEYGGSYVELPIVKK